MIKENQNFLNKINAVSDIVILFISMTLAYLIRFHIFSSDSGYIKLITYLQFSVIIIPINLIVFNFLIFIILLELKFLLKSVVK